MPPTYTDESVFDGLAPEVMKALRRCGGARLYQHWADAIRHAQDGSNVVLQEPTASGKTLALDQRDQLMCLTDQMGGPHIESWGYDGDVNSETRRLLRESLRCLLFPEISRRMIAQVYFHSLEILFLHVKPSPDVTECVLLKSRIGRGTERWKANHQTQLRIVGRRSRSAWLHLAQRPPSVTGLRAVPI